MSRNPSQPVALMDEALTHFVQGLSAPDLSNTELVVRHATSSLDNLRADYREGIRLVRIARLVYRNDSDHIDEMLNVCSAVAVSNCALLLLLKGDPAGVSLYLGTRSPSGRSNSEALHHAHRTLLQALRGQFPGSAIDELSPDESAELMSNRSPFWRDVNAVAALQGVPTRRGSRQDGFVQELDRFIDAMRGHEYAVVLVAEPMGSDSINRVLKGQTDLYSLLSPLQQWQLHQGTNTSVQLSESEQRSIGQSLSKAVGESQSTSVSRSNSTTESTGTSKSIYGGLNIKALNIGGSYGSFSSTATATSESNTDGATNSTTRTKGESTTTTHGNSRSMGEGTSHTHTTTHTNRLIQFALKHIDLNIERINTGQGYGFWQTGLYVAACDVATAQVAAGLLHGLYRGDKSSVQPARVSFWNSSDSAGSFAAARRAIQRFQHPQVNVIALRSAAFQRAAQVDGILPTSMLSGSELALLFTPPQVSVPGLTVSHHPSFGRQVTRLDAQTRSADPTLSLGLIYHHSNVETGYPVRLDLRSLVRHTFIAGSTGSGKSNTTVTLLERLARQGPGTPFLVIEPVKDEYRRLHGLPSAYRPRRLTAGEPGTEWLRINPFRFPAGFHVYAHLDRLAQVFNAAFPMYASMPALLEEALRRSYQRCGWDLANSRCRYQPARFPTLHHLLEELDAAVAEAGYSTQLSSDFSGALGARIRSLTRGIKGELLCPLPGDETPAEVLFNQNCIVNLRNIGAADTKSLLMGLLLTRLYEQRQCEMESQAVRDAVSKRGLRHLTVIEEAHTLLRRTSTDVSMEGANLRGMAVEMFSDAIAEMRAMGQGFVVVDQSPTTIDSSVLKNTNTKIIHRLPYAEDRTVAGGTLNATPEQIEELGRLPTGVAAIFQNDWLGPVLCKVHKATTDSQTRDHPHTSRVELSREQMLMLTSFPSSGKIHHTRIAALLMSTQHTIESAMSEIARRLDDVESGDLLIGLYDPTRSEQSYGQLCDRWHLAQGEHQRASSLFQAHLANLLGFQPSDPIISDIERIQRADPTCLTTAQRYFW